MAFPLWLMAIMLGVIEGLTEFIPVSSTAHLIFGGSMIGFEQALANKERAALFEVFIQLGAVLAVFNLYWPKLLEIGKGAIRSNPVSLKLIAALIIAFLPAAIVGLLTHNLIEEHLLSPLTAAGALVVGGIAILVIERLPLKASTTALEGLTLRQALIVGLAQVLALFPGVSRSGSTIMGGLCCGIDRSIATEFSFLLSLPIMLAASGLVLLKHFKLIDPPFLGILMIGFVSAFFAAWFVVKWLIQYVRHHNFNAFAVYRIIFGLALLWFFWPK
jgi:undecaprenyl-diphosphatase